MADNIRVMISSRCSDEFPLDGKLQPLSELRKRIKKAVESEPIFGDKTFSCWINDDPRTPAGDGSQHAWDYCLGQVARADIVVALYNGRAGWIRTGGSNGVCHAEIEKAMTTGGAKLRVVNLDDKQSKFVNATPSAEDKRFATYLEQQNPPYWGAGKVKSGEDAMTRVKDAIRDALIELVQLGAREARKGVYDRGEALEWSRKDFPSRKGAIEEVMQNFFKESFPPVGRKNSKRIICTVDSRKILVCCHGIPDALAVASARELVGQPQLYDFKQVDIMAADVFGPVHFIGCFHGIAEGQVKTLLGCPDITTVKTSFGVYAADKINQTQIVFLSNCRDSTATRNGLDKFFTWVAGSGEAQHIARRAESRSRIIRAIDAESKLK